MFRTVLFWCHLIAGLFAGVVVLIMSVTGVVLTYEKQMLAWHDRRTAAIAPPPEGTPRASIATIAERVKLSAPEAAITTITRRNDPAAPVTVALTGGLTILVHPYTGHVLGEAPTGLRSAFRTTTDWHRYLAGTGERRTLGKAITGACNLAFLFLVISGSYLWLPRRWTASALRAVAIPRWTHATGKARDFNWHNALGLWSAVPLAIVVASATVISYPWASDLAYRVVGDTPPPRPAAPAAPGGAGGGRGPGGPGGQGGPGGPERPAGDGRAAPPVVVSPALDTHWATAEASVSDWRSIALRMPSNPRADLVFTIDAGYGGQPQHRATLTIDGQSGAAKGREVFADQSIGRRFRSMLRFAHTGEFWGLPGQTVAGIVSAAACVLVWTGFSLAWRRFWSWRRRSNGEPLERAA